MFAASKKRWIVVGFIALASVGAVVAAFLVSTGRQYNIELCEKFEVGDSILKIGDEIDAHGLSHVLQGIERDGEFVKKYIVWKNIPLGQNFCVAEYDNEVIKRKYIETKSIFSILGEI